jgi:D-arabinose 1-dehydrogenase-like Zn-dependent alcohol dehydrogenase
MNKFQTELCGKETTYKQVKREVVKLRKKVYLLGLLGIGSIKITKLHLWLRISAAPVN